MEKKPERDIYTEILLLIIFLLAISSAYAFAQEKGKSNKPLTEEEKIVQAIKNVKPSVVNIKATGIRASGDGFTETGSGIVLKQNGFILTNYHVIKDAKDITVTISDGQKFHAILAGRSPRDDLAVLKIPVTGLKVPKWGNSKDLKIGQIAIAIGNPYKFDWSVSRGIISALNRRIPAAGILYQEMIQTDAAINPGSSGGALIDSSGKVIGINTLVYTGDSRHAATGLGFAIPIHRALKVSNMLLAQKTYYDPKPWIGVGGIDVTQEIAENHMLPVQSGVLITEVNPSGPAHDAGLKKGDIVVQANDQIVRKVSDLKKILASTRPGDTLKFNLWRGEKNMTLNIKVSQRSVQ